MRTHPTLADFLVVVITAAAALGGIVAARRRRRSVFVVPATKWVQIATITSR